MRPGFAFLATLLFAALPARAHADDIYTDFMYTGTVLLNGYWAYSIGFYGDQVRTTYNNYPISETVTIRQFLVSVGGAPTYEEVLEEADVSIPDPEFTPYYVEQYLDFPNCLDNQYTCDEVYLDNTDTYYLGVPSPTVSVDGVRNYFDNDDQANLYTSWEENYSGDLHLVTAATPEPSTFALLGTGLCSLVLTKRRARRS